MDNLLFSLSLFLLAGVLLSTCYFYIQGKKSGKENEQNKAYKKIFEVKAEQERIASEPLPSDSFIIDLMRNDKL
jgi:uncharacterized membrane protein affecting hemolysin expression